MSKHSVKNGGRYLVWDGCQALTIGSILILVPLALSLPHSETIGETVLGWTVSLLFLADSLVYRKDKHKKWMHVLEWISIIPFIPLFHMLLDGHELVPFTGALHLVRFPIFVTRLRRHKEVFSLAKWHQVGSILFFFAIMVHGVACGWLWINGLKGDASWTAYVKAVYWAVTTLGTVGYGDIAPTDNLGRFYAMGVMIIGIGIFGLIIGQVSRFIMAGDKRAESNREKMEHLENFMRHYEIPKDVRQRVFQFYQHLIAQHANDEERKILSDLPQALQNELQIFMNIKPISKLRLFRGASLECLKDVARNLERVFYSPGDRIIKKGDSGHEMYVIGHGELDVHDGNHHIATIHDGQCFGEMSLVQDETRSADVTSTSYCDLFVLSKEKFMELSRTHQILKKNIQEIMVERQRAA